MNKKGFILLKVTIGLFFVGLLATIFIPILSSSLNNFNKVKNKNEMNYIGEMVVEKLKTSSPDIISIIADLEDIGEVNYVDNDFDSLKYNCRIIKTNSSNGLLEFIVKIKLNNQEKAYYVEYKASRSKK